MRGFGVRAREFGVMSGGRQQVQEPRWLLEEWQLLYKLTTFNAEHALCLTMGTVAVCLLYSW